MKFTLSWLKQHLETQADVQTIADKLTAIGLEVEDVVDKSEVLRPFTVAEILHAEKHPQADRLRVCKVNDGKGERTVVCGAANARAGIKVILATEGTTIPASGMKLKKTAIRGVESNGMLCSAKELELGTDSEGIVELPASVRVGESIVTALGLDDPVFDIAVTPNRGDCLSVRGIARDLAAAGLGTLKPLAVQPVKGSFKSSVNVKISDTQRCPMFVGRLIRGVKNGPSPEWLQQRLTAIGLRPISSLVDITNLFTVDLGRPLHVYDAKKLQGDILVRPARDGEKFLALNDKEYTLSNGMTAITDDSGVIGLGGIIGGISTGCDENTVDVFLEAALFDPTAIAEAGRALGIDSDARYRFERGVDPAFVKDASELATRMIQTLCGGEASEVVIAGEQPAAPKPINFPVSRVKQLGGVDMPAQEIVRIFTLLGFTVSGSGETLTVTPPAWRHDVSHSADLVEEILRIHSYDKIPATPLPKPTSIAKPTISLAQKRIGIARRTLAAQGMLECQTWAFLPYAHAKLFGHAGDELKLLNPISADLDTLRPSLLPNLINAARRNHQRGFRNVAFFEAGTQFGGTTMDKQITTVAGIRTGQTAGRNVHKTARAVDVFDAKADACAALEALGVNTAKLQITTQLPNWYHPGKAGALTLGGKIVLGYFGEIHPFVLQQMEVKETTVGFELFPHMIPEPKKTGKARPPLVVSDYPAVERDFAFLVDESVTAADMIKTIEGVDKTLIREVALFDVYQGKGVTDGKKSVALTMTIQAPDRTLTEEELTTLSQKVVEAAKGFGGELRS